MSDLSDNVLLVLPTKTEFVSTARLTASSVANRIGFNIDEVEDIKVAVSEACNIILSHSGNSKLQYSISFGIYENKIEITFKGYIEDLECFKDKLDNEYGLFIMEALMDCVELCNDNHSIVMTKRIGE